MSNEQIGAYNSNYNNKEEVDEDYINVLLSDRGNEPVNVDLKSIKFHLPHWYNAEKFRRGQLLIRYHIASYFAGMLAGLISILAIPTIHQVLICTGKSTAVKDAYRRYVETIYHVLAWTDYELHPGSKSWKSIELIRRKHVSAKNFCKNSNNITICQRDMAVTQFAFCGFPLIKSKMVGIHKIKRQELENVIHFWRTIGFLMGITEEFNACTEDINQTMKRLNGILTYVLRPALENGTTNKSFNTMTQAMIGGMQYFNSQISFQSGLYLTKKIAGCKGFEHGSHDLQCDKIEYNKLSKFQRFIVRFFIFLTDHFMRFTIGRQIINFWIRFDEFCSFYFPWTAMIDYGLGKAYVRIFD